MSLIVLFLFAACSSEPSGNFYHTVQKTLNRTEESDKGIACHQVPIVMNEMLRKHFEVNAYTEEIKERSVDLYIKWIDYSKSILLESDVTFIKKELRAFMNNVKKVNCSNVENIHKLVLQRIEENYNFVKEFLGKNYTFNENISFVSDPKKRSFAKNTTEKQNFLKKSIHFQYSNYLISGTKKGEAKKFLIKRYFRQLKRHQEKTKSLMRSEFLKAFANALDPHTTYFTEKETTDFKIDMSLQLEGIGASLTSEEGMTVVKEIIKGGAADRAQVLRPEDKIVAVGNSEKTLKTIIDQDLKDVVAKIRGKKGTKVFLKIVREEDKETKKLIISIIRDKIRLKDSEIKISYEKRMVKGVQKTFGVVDFPAFYGSPHEYSRDKSKAYCYEHMKKILKEAAQKNLDGLLIKLDENGGGSLPGSIAISGLFIDEGGIVGTKDATDRVTVFDDPDSGISYSGPLVILTSRASASASEIMSGALKAYNRAVIVGGDHTFGKGTVQQFEELPNNLGATKITTAVFFIPNGETTQHQGVDAHITLPSTLNSDEIGEKAQDYSIKPRKIDSFVSKKSNLSGSWKPLTASTIAQLKNASESRVTQSKEFDEIRKDIAEIKENEKDKGVVYLSKYRKKAIKKKAKDGDKEKSYKEKKEELRAPYVSEALNILADLSTML